MFTKTNKKILAIILAVMTIFSCMAIVASAASLADCFTSGSKKYTELKTNIFTDTLYYYKIAWGKTENYGKKHYIRSYVSKDMDGDSGRVWSTYPHKKHYVESKPVFTGTDLAGSLGIGYTAYSKYGTS